MNAKAMDATKNPMGTKGFAFLEFTGKDAQAIADHFKKMGFKPVAEHRSKQITLFRQADIYFFLNQEPSGHAAEFRQAHGQSTSAMGFLVDDADSAFKRAIELGAKQYADPAGLAFDIPAILGIGDSLLYLVDDQNFKNLLSQFEFNDETIPQGLGLTFIDHVTHNVYQGQMDQWADFYERFFNFREIRFFDIRGEQTGLLSRAMTSPCGKIRIPLNEATEEGSQIAEYLREYQGEGIQHIALHTDTIYQTVQDMREQSIAFLDVPETYYEMIGDRIPWHSENLTSLQENKILIDGGKEKKDGLLLQIFTQNMLGPIFFEVIQRKGDEGFGEGNFQALFESMEQDQIRRGVLKKNN